MVEVRSAASASSGIDSCHRMCESYVQPYSKPCCSARLSSSSMRWYGGSGKTVTPNVMAMAERLQLRNVTIIGTGLNYASHLRDQGREPPEEPLLFLKPGAAVIGSGDPIVLPREATHTD